VRGVSVCVVCVWLCVGCEWGVVRTTGPRLRITTSGTPRSSAFMKNSWNIHRSVMRKNALNDAGCTRFIPCEGHPSAGLDRGHASGGLVWQRRHRAFVRSIMQVETYHMAL
jgi:hypothetical protein